MMNTLYDKLKLAARNHISAEEVRMMIGEAPILDTKDELDKKAFRGADFELNEGLAIILEEMKKSERVIYWKVDNNPNLATIAGLAWPDRDKSVFFSGKVLPP